MFSLHIDGVIKKNKYIMYYVINSMFLFIFIVFFDCRCCYHHYNDDVTTRFLLLKHFWPLINNVLHQNEGLHIDGLNKKIIISPTGVKMSLRTPSPPRGGTSLWWLLTTTAPQKNEKKTFTTTSFTGTLTQSTVCSTYPNYRPFYHLWHTIHWKHPYIMHYKQHQIVVDATNSGVKAILSSFQLFDHVWTMVYINVTYFAMTVYPWYYWHVDRTPSSPGSTPQPPRDDTSLCISITPRPQKMDIIATFWPCLNNGLQ
jgi:hypothetical protein